MSDQKTGPLADIRVIELAGLGPAPFAAMMLADMGAEVIRVERPGPPQMGPDSMNRGKRSIVLDLRRPAGVTALLDLVEKADVLIEAFRPGVAERLGVGPQDCWARNAKLVYGRMTGWGQSGPRASEAGHDIGYIGLTGALHAIGPEAGPPVPPLALLGDLGGGGMFLVTGILAAIHESTSSGKGQVVDAAIVDGVSALMGPFYGMMAQGGWVDRRESNLLDGGAPFYRAYETADGRWLAVGAIEDQFYAELLQLLGIPEDEGNRHPKNWPALQDRIAAAVKTKTRDEWEEIFDGTDACVAPVRSMTEAPDDPHLAARGTFVKIDGQWQPTPAPRFDRTPPATPLPATKVGSDTAAVLSEWGVAGVEKLIADGVAEQRS